MASRSVLDILEAQGTVTNAITREVRAESRESGKPVEDLLLARGVPERAIIEAKSTILGIPVRDLAGVKVPFDVLKYIPEESARHYAFVPLALVDNVLDVGMVAPDDLQAREALQFISSGTNTPFRIFLIAPSDLQLVLEEYRGLSGEVTKALGELAATKEEELTLPKIHAAEEIKLEAEGPITKMVTVMLRHALEGRASDVHIEPGKDRMRVRFRVDSVLYTSLFLPMNVHDAIVARIKIMTNMKIDEKRVPQDGRFKATIGGREIDFRVSTLPTYFGEKVAIRVLDPEQGMKSLPSLGLEGRNLTLVEEALKRPFGLILITGPTGSGKSTTLYAMMQKIDREKRNIISLEDPIEYYIEGMNQSQMRPEIKYSFASGLRSVLRQDPDVIMVGEIRDKETAKLAIHAALTGHLVLSTLHTNNAVGVIPRLIDMGVDPFLIPSTLTLAIAQRLTQRLCDESRKEILIEGSAGEFLKDEIAKFPEAVRKTTKLPSKTFEALPSSSCPKGTRGRIAVFEALSMTRELEDIILKDASEIAIRKEAERQGMLTMRQDGILKVLNGVIGLEQLSEVAV